MKFQLRCEWRETRENPTRNPGDPGYVPPPPPPPPPSETPPPPPSTELPPDVINPSY